MLAAGEAAGWRQVELGGRWHVVGGTEAAWRAWVRVAIPSDLALALRALERGAAA